MIIWRGYGILVPIVAGVAYVLAVLILQAISPQSSSTDPLTKMVGMVVAGACVWQVGRAFNRRIPPGHAGHSLFFVPMEYWGLIAAAVGVYAYFGG